MNKALSATVMAAATSGINLYIEGQKIAASLATIKDQLVEHGKVEHARLGVEIQPLSQALAKSFGLDKPDGALIAKVAPDSAAAKAGLQPGDVLQQVGRAAVDSPKDAAAKMREAKDSKKPVLMKVYREGSTRFVAISPRAA